MYSFAAVYRSNDSQKSKETWRRFVAKIEGYYLHGTKIYDRDGLIVFEQPDRPSGFQSHQLEGGAGIILGVLFHPKPNGQISVESRRAPSVINDRESENIVRTGCRWLRDNYWGSFVSIVRNREDDSLFIYRSPGSSIPCFCFERDGIYVIFSKPALFGLFGKDNFEIDWEFAGLLAKRSHFYHERTGIKDVTRIRSAQCLTIKGGKQDYTWLWDPLEIAKGADLVDVNKAAAAMRLAAFDCTRAWATIHPKPLVSLSGGLDSSLVVGLAAQFNQPSDIVCVTWYNDSPLLDERAYARTTAGRVGAELIEYKLRPEKFIKREAYDRFEFSPLPFSANYEMERAPFLAKVMQERDLSAVYYGNAGDGLFFSSGDNLALIDYFISCGLGRKTFSVALSSAQVSETSLLRSFWVAIMAKAGYFSEQTSRDPDYGWGLCREFKNNIDAEEKYFAPWEWPHAKVPHGKRTQIWGVMGESQYMNLLTGVPPLPVVELFLAQPLVEVCLQIPTYILQFNGRERGLARRAFKDCLSREVKLRRFKSHLSDYADDHVRTNAAMLKEYLLDGVLARNGILDKLVIEQFFNAPAQASEIHFARITHLVDTEAWARRWY